MKEILMFIVVGGVVTAVVFYALILAIVFVIKFIRWLFTGR